MAAGENASVDDYPARQAGSWRPIGFGNPDGDVVECWACPLPAGFVERLDGDVEALRMETAEGAASGRGVLVEANRVTVDGRPALRRIVRLPAGVISAAVYVAEQVIPVADEVGLEITVTCGALSDPLAGSFGRRQRPNERQRRPRPVRVGGKVRIKTPRPGLAAARERAGHTQATLAAAVGVLTQTVSYWETGAKEPRARYRSPLAMALGISLKELDRLIRGEAFHPPGVTQVAGPGTEHWVIDVACLPRRPYSEVPLPATALMFSAASSEDGLSRARRILAEISPAIRIITPTAALAVEAARTPCVGD